MERLLILRTVRVMWRLARLNAGVRSWFAQALVTRARQARGNGHEWQFVHAPVFVRLFGQVRRRRRRDGALVRFLMVLGLLAAALFIAIWPGEANAQTRCGEGRTASGQCINAALASAARQTAVIHSQWRLSSTAYPVLPSADYRYRYPNDLIPPSPQVSAIGTLVPSLPPSPTPVVVPPPAPPAPPPTPPPAPPIL